MLNDLYRLSAYFYAAGRLDAIEPGVLGSGDVITDFVERVAAKRLIPGFEAFSIYNEWNKYAAELQQMVTVDLGTTAGGVPEGYNDYFN